LLQKDIATSRKWRQKTTWWLFELTALASTLMPKAFGTPKAHELLPRFGLK
jgi:hypothetical protein